MSKSHLIPIHCIIALAVGMPVASAQKGPLRPPAAQTKQVNAAKAKTRSTSQRAPSNAKAKTQDRPFRIGKRRLAEHKRKMYQQSKSPMNQSPKVSPFTRAASRVKKSRNFGSFSAGTDVDLVVQWLSARAAETGKVHTAVHNGTTLRALPGDSPAKIKQPWLEQHQPTTTKPRLSRVAKMVSKFDTKPVIVRSVGETLPQLAARLSRMAAKTGRHHVGNFNGVELRANPGDTPAWIMAPGLRQRGIARGKAKQRVKADRETRQQKLYLLGDGTFGNRGSAQLIHNPPAGMRLDPRAFAKTLFGKSKFYINHVTQEQFDELPMATVLYHLDGSRHIIGVDKINQEVRAGFMNYGFKATDPGKAVIHPERGGLQTPLMHRPPQGIKLSRNGFMEAGRDWSVNGVKVLSIPQSINRITANQLKAMPKGTVLYSAWGTQIIVGVDKINPKNRKDGFTRYGFRASSPGVAR